MTDADIKHLLDLAERKLKEKVTKEEALESFVRAGIMDKDGNYTEPYKNLATVIKPLDPNLP